VSDTFADLISKEREATQMTLSKIRDHLPIDPWEASAYAVSMGLAIHVPRMLYEAWKEGAIPDLELALWAVWVHNRSPLQGLGERRWLQLFKAAGFAVVTGGTAGTVAEYEHLSEKPTEPITVWRGAALTNGRGMSWSVHRGCARGFAVGVSQDGIESAVFEATVPVRAVLALFGDAREQECVVNPNMLRGRVRIDEMIPAQGLRTWPPA